MNTQIINNIMYRELVSTMAFALKMGKKNGIQDPQMAIADCYNWADNVKAAIHNLVPNLGWPALEEMEAGRVMRRVPEPKTPWTEADVAEAMNANLYSFYNHAYWFAKAMTGAFENIGFDRPIQTHEQVLQICSTYLEEDISPDGGYNGTNVRKNSDWFEKNQDRQEFLRDIMELLETRNPLHLAQVHTQIMESHMELVDNQRKEQEEKLSKVAKQLFGADFEFQKIPKMSSKIPAFDPAKLQ